MRTKFLWLAIVFSTQSVYASAGDVIRIDHDKLVSYEKAQDADCAIREYDQRGQIKFRYAVYNHWLFFTIRDDGAEKKVAWMTHGTSSFSPDCERAKEESQKILQAMLFDIDDMQNGYVTINANGTCETRYLLGIEKGAVTRIDGSEAIVTNGLVWRKRAVACPR